MAKKLFALEYAEIGEEVVEMEAAPEVGEVADVEVAVQEEAGEAEAQAEAIDDGMGAADQLEQVEEIVEQAAEGEGLDPVAADAVKVAVEAICARIGANPKSVYSLYATENFQSASSRKANTKIALEGVGEFLKDMWKKIKAALMKLWEKVKAFWNIHFSNLGRVKKALDSMKKRVADSSGKMEKAYVEEAPSGLASAFVGKDDISASTVEGFISAHVDADKAVEGAAKIGQDLLGEVEASIGTDKKVSVKESKFEVGTESKPLVGGVYTTYTISGGEGEIEVQVDREVVTGEGKRGLNVADKAALAKVISSATSMIEGDIKKKADFDKKEAEFKKSMVDVEKKINASVADKATNEAAKETRKALKIAFKANSRVPGIMADKAVLDVKLAKAVLGYAATCLKSYE